MNDFGLKYAVLINPRYFGWDNSYISHSLHKYPKLFVAHGLLDPEDPNVADRLRYWVKEHGFQGMRFSPIYHPNSTWLNSKEHYPLWREAERLGAVFNYYILPHQMPMLEDMAGRFPGVKIVVDHLGKPDLKLADPWPEFRKMFRLKKFPQVWISASEPYELSLDERVSVPRHVSVLQGDLRRVRRQATDLGHRLSAATLGVAHGQGTRVRRQVSWTFYTADRELLLGKNALRIWRFPKQ